MHALATWEATPTYDPNKRQYVREQFAAIPGSYASWYWNPKPNAASLGAAGFSGLPAWGQVSIIAALAATAGYLGLKYAGPKLGVKGQLKGWYGSKRRR